MSLSKSDMRLAIGGGGTIELRTSLGSALKARALKLVSQAVREPKIFNS